MSVALTRASKVKRPHESRAHKGVWEFRKSASVQVSAVPRCCYSVMPFCAAKLWRESAANAKANPSLADYHKFLANVKASFLWGSLWSLDSGQALYGSQNLSGVSVNLHPAPLADDFAVATHDEGRAFNTKHLLAVHVLLLDDVEQFAHHLVFVREQVEGEVHLRPKFVVARHAITRDAENHVAESFELGVQVAELGLRNQEWLWSCWSY